MEIDPTRYEGRSGLLYERETLEAISEVRSGRLIPPIKAWQGRLLTLSKAIEEFKAGRILEEKLWSLGGNMEVSQAVKEMNPQTENDRLRVAVEGLLRPLDTYALPMHPDPKEVRGEMNKRVIILAAVYLLTGKNFEKSLALSFPGRRLRYEEALKWVRGIDRGESEADLFSSYDPYFQRADILARLQKIL